MSPYGVRRPQRVKTVNDVGIHNQERWDLHNKVNIMSANDLETQGARSPASMALTKLAWNMLLPIDVGQLKMIPILDHNFFEFKRQQHID